MLDDIQVEIFEFMRRNIKFQTKSDIVEGLGGDEATVAKAVEDMVTKKILIHKDGKYIFDVKQEINSIAIICGYNRMRPSDISFLKENREEASRIFEAIVSEHSGTNDMFTQMHLNCIKELIKAIR